MSKLKKYFKSLIMLTLALVFAFSFDLTSEAKSNQEYTYSVRFLSGGDAIFTGTNGILVNNSSAIDATISDDQKKLVISNLHYGDLVTFSYSDFMKCQDGSKYNLAGLKEAGTENVAAAKIRVEKDVDYVAMYSLADLVSYTVSYVDENGNKLAAERVYMGPIGEKIAVPYVYVDGYAPDAISKTITLKSDASLNNVTFKYKKGYFSPDGGRTYVYGKDTESNVTYAIDGGNTTVSNEANSGADNTVVNEAGNANDNAASQANGANAGNDANNAGNANAGNGDNAGNANDNGDGTQIEDEEVPLAPEEVIDIDDEQVAKAGGMKTSSIIYLIAGVIIALAIFAIVMVVVLSKKKRALVEVAEDATKNNNEK